MSDNRKSRKLAKDGMRGLVWRVVKLAPPCAAILSVILVIASPAFTKQQDDEPMLVPPPVDVSPLLEPSEPDKPSDPQAPAVVPQNPSEESKPQDLPSEEPQPKEPVQTTEPQETASPEPSIQNDPTLDVRQPAKSKVKKQEIPTKGEPVIADGDLKAKLLRTGKITLRDATLNEALFAIRNHWDISIVFGNDLQGEVNAVFNEQPLYKILDTLLFSRGYGYRQVGSSLVIMKREDIKGMDPLFETVTVPLKYGEVGDIENLVAQLGIQSPNGKLLAIPSAKAILVMDYPDRIADIRKNIEMLEDQFKETALAQARAQAQSQAQSNASSGDSSKGGKGRDEDIPLPQPEIRTGFFRAYNVKTDDLRESLQAMLSKEGTLTTIPAENQIVVNDYVSNLDRVREAIRVLDIPRPQVRIWAFIYDASLDDVKRIGLNFNQNVKGRNLLNGQNQDRIGLNSVTAPNPATGTTNGGLTFLSLNTNYDVTAVLNMLATSKNSRLLANPQVACIDKETAKIAIVTEIPYQQLTQGGNSGGPIGTTAFREAGVTLEVTPNIADNGWIQMNVKPTFSLLTGFTQQSNQPIIDKREASTTVWIPDGETFVIGGLRQRQANHEGAGVPGFQDMRFGFGYLFRNRQSTVRESELLVFLTPQVINQETKQLIPREALAYDYGRYMLGRMPTAPFPNGENCAPRGDYRTFTAPPGPANMGYPPNGPQNGPMPPAPTNDMAPTQEVLPPPGGTNGQAVPSQVEEARRRSAADRQRAAMRSRGPDAPIIAKRLPPANGSGEAIASNQTGPQYADPNGNVPYGAGPYAAGQNGVASNYGSPYGSRAIAPVTAELPTRYPAADAPRPAPSAPAEKKPPKTVWEAIKGKQKSRDSSTSRG